MKTRSILMFIAAALCLAGLASTPGRAQSGSAPSDRSKRIGDPYPLADCPSMPKKNGSLGEPIVKLYGGREVRFCCVLCPPLFERDLAANLARLDDVMAKDQLPLYPLETSVVSGKALDSKAVNFVYGNRLVRLADESEKDDFLKDAKKYLAALDKAVIEKQSKDYPLTKCPVTDEELGKGDMGEPKDMVVAGRLIRLCCGGCAKDVIKEPAKYIAMVDEARKSGQQH